MKIFFKKTAFTLVELVVSIGILVMISVWLFIFISSTYDNLDNVKDLQQDIKKVLNFEQEIVKEKDNWFSYDTTKGSVYSPWNNWKIYVSFVKTWEEKKFFVFIQGNKLNFWYWLTNPDAYWLINSEIYFDPATEITVDNASLTKVGENWKEIFLLDFSIKWEQYNLYL